MAWSARRLCLFSVFGLIFLPSEANAFELSGGVGVGGVLAGAKPRFAVSPHVGISWGADIGFRLAFHDICAILPATNSHGPGVHNQISGGVSYAIEKAEFSLGPSLAVYSIPACNDTDCARVTGVAPGALAQAEVHLTGPLGVSVSATVEWVGGSSDILPGSVAATAVIGPVLRWSPK